MNKFFFPLFFNFAFLVFNSSFAQAPSIQWAKCYGGSDVDLLFSARQTTDGGYIAAGTTYSTNGDVSGNHGDLDFWVVKTDSAGTLLWQKCLGGSVDDQARDIKQTTDGGYIVAGSAESNDGDVSGNHGWDYWIVKLDSSGNIEWQKCHGGTSNDDAYSIQQTKDGGYIVAGNGSSTDGEVTGPHGLIDYWIIKLDTAGDIQWEKSLGGTSNDNAYSIIQTYDGGYIVAGQTLSNDSDVTGNHGNSDCWIVKIDSAGAIQWQNCFGGSGEDNAWSIIQARDSGYVFAGKAAGFNNGNVSGSHGYDDFWLVKLDTSGALLWQKCLGGSGYDIAYSLLQESDGGYIIAGGTGSNDFDVSGNHSMNGDYWIIKTDSVGNLQWQKCFGGTSGETACSIEATRDSGYIVGGFTTSNNGDVTGYHALKDFWLVKLAPLGLSVSAHQEKDFTVYPNPVEEQLKIKNSELRIEKAEIVNLVGESIYSISGNDKELTVNCSALPAAMYFVNIQTEKGIIIKKFIKE